MAIKKFDDASICLGKFYYYMHKYVLIQILIWF